jgi:hypothetical protein
MEEALPALRDALAQAGRPIHRLRRGVDRVLRRAGLVESRRPALLAAEASAVAPRREPEPEGAAAEPAAAGADRPGEGGRDDAE